MVRPSHLHLFQSVDHRDRVWVIAKISMSVRGGGGYNIMYLSIYRGVRMEVCVTAKLSLSESKREFLYNIFCVSSCQLGV